MEIPYSWQSKMLSMVRVQVMSDSISRDALSGSAAISRYSIDSWSKQAEVMDSSID
jgi:hypothetical protein